MPISQLSMKDQVSLLVAIFSLLQTFNLVYADDLAKEILATQHGRDSVLVFDKEPVAEQGNIGNQEDDTVPQRTEALSIHPHDVLTAKMTRQTPGRRAAWHLVEKGKKLLAAGEYEKALARFERAMVIDSDPYIYYYLARTHHHLAHYKESLNFLEVAESWLGEHGLAEMAALKQENARASRHTGYVPSPEANSGRQVGSGKPPARNSPPFERQQADAREPASFLKGSTVIESLALAGLFSLAFFYRLYFARASILPVTLAFLLKFLLAPVARGLKYLYIPESLGSAVVLLRRSKRWQAWERVKKPTS